jgi:hypothetical protein
MASPAFSPRGWVKIVTVLVAALVFTGVGFVSSFGQEERSIKRERSGNGAESVAVDVGDLYGVVVGVSRYGNVSIPKLTFADKDAQDFSAFLNTQNRLFRKIHLTTLLNEQATCTEVKKQLHYGLRRAGKDDTIVLFLSGHGSDDPTTPGEYFFLPYDADPQFLEATAVNLTQMKFMQRLDSRRIVFIADTCHSGGFSTEGRKGAEPSLSHLMRRFKESEGRVILSSARPDEYSLENPKLGNGVFTYYLLEGLKGKADLNNDGVVTLKEAYDYVYEQTRQETQGVQHPQWEGRVAGEFPLSVSVTINITVASKPDKIAPNVVHIKPTRVEPKIGEYHVHGANPNGSTYHGTVTLRKQGEKYLLAWKIGEQTFYGEGTFSGENLYINWGKSRDSLTGLVTYQVMENSVLKGTWANGQGTETLVPK